jgi:hypothetical protein
MRRNIIDAYPSVKDLEVILKHELDRKESQEFLRDSKKTFVHTNEASEVADIGKHLFFNRESLLRLKRDLSAQTRGQKSTAFVVESEANLDERPASPDRVDTRTSLLAARAVGGDAVTIDGRQVQYNGPPIDVFYGTTDAFARTNDYELVARADRGDSAAAWRSNPWPVSFPRSASCPLAMPMFVTKMSGRRSPFTSAISEDMPCRSVPPSLCCSNVPLP